MVTHFSIQQSAMLPFWLAFSFREELQHIQIYSSWLIYSQCQQVPPQRCCFELTWQIVQTTGSQHPQHTGMQNGFLLARIAAGNRSTVDTQGVTRDIQATSWDHADDCISFRFPQDLALHFFLFPVRVLVVQLWLLWVDSWWQAGKTACIEKWICFRGDLKKQQTTLIFFNWLERGNLTLIRRTKSWRLSVLFTINQNSV